MQAQTDALCVLKDISALINHETNRAHDGCYCGKCYLVRQINSWLEPFRAQLPKMSLNHSAITSEDNKSSTQDGSKDPVAS